MASHTQSILALLALAAVLVAGCAPQAPPGTGNDNDGGFQTTGVYQPVTAFDPQDDLEPRRFANEDEFAAFVRASQDNGGGYFGGALMERSAVAMDAATGAPVPTMAAGSAKSESGGSGNSFSGTNNQVAGVDEGDILKTDGEYIYTVTGNTVFVIKAYPGEDAEVVSTIELKQTPNALFIDGDRLAVMGNFYDQDYFKEQGIRPRWGMTFLNVYDVSDRSDPIRVDDYVFEGSYFQSRMIDGTMYLVLTSGIDRRVPEPPIYFVDGVKRGVPATDVYYYPIPYRNPQLATVHAVPFMGGDVESATLAVENVQTIYMSEGNLYIAASEYLNEWEMRRDIQHELLEGKLTASDKALIARIKETPDDVLSRAEKESKIGQVYDDVFQYELSSDEQQDMNDAIDTRLKDAMEDLESLEYTIIHRVAVGSDGIEVERTGKVPGTLNNQFSLDEFDGYLRVATTVNPRWNQWIRPMVRGASEGIAVEVDAPASEPSSGSGADAKMAPDIMPPRDRSQPTNNVYVLDRRMEVVGKVTDIAPGERIFSTRFMGERLYMVTFRQVDPFFAIDLSDPTDPEILGELKIPGFSRYLHPYDEHTIIGIGRDASDTGRQEGLKISLFDVTNVEKPKEIAKWVSEDDFAQSTAEWEHKAFLFDKEKELLVIPAFSYANDWQGGTRDWAFNGAMVFRITSDSIKVRGVVDHGQGKDNQYYGQLVERSLYIEDLLYTKSPNLLRINALSDLSKVKNVALVSDGKDAGPYPVY